MPLSDEQLAAMRGRVEAAKPGPWFSGHLFDAQAGDYMVWRNKGGKRCYIGSVGALTEPVLAIEEDDVVFAAEKADAAFIAACREDIPALLDEVRALRAERCLLSAERDAGIEMIERLREERARYKAALEEIEALGTIESMRQTEIAARALAGGVQGAAE